MPEKMKLVTTRMEPSLHRNVMREAKRWGETFGQFMRNAATSRVETLSRWEPVAKEKRKKLK